MIETTAKPPRTGTIRICIVDDHPLMHDGLRYMASQTTDIEFCGGVTSGRDLDGLVRTAEPDVLLADVNLGGENSFALCRRIKDRQPSIQILIVSAFGDAHLVQRSIRAGASGYALKSVSMAELPAAIRRVHEKGNYFSPSLSDQVLVGLGRPDHGLSNMSPRETLIVRMIAEGMTNVQMSHELSISVHTVKFHISRLLQQHGCRRRSELVKLADQFH